jgi:putative nucleotidyltransferase with HDIG domain
MILIMGNYTVRPPTDRPHRPRDRSPGALCPPPPEVTGSPEAPAAAPEISAPSARVPRRSAVPASAQTPVGASARPIAPPPSPDAMKPPQFLLQQVHRWHFGQGLTGHRGRDRRRSRAGFPWLKNLQCLWGRMGDRMGHQVGYWQSCLCTASPGQPISTQQRRRTTARQSHARIFLVVAIAVLTAAMSHPYLNQPLYDVGTVAPQDIRAPYDATVVDRKTTELLQSDARKGVTPVLRVDPAVNRQMQDDLSRLLDRGTELRLKAGPLPFMDTALLSTGVQSYLRSAPPDTWATLLAQVSGPANPGLNADAPEGFEGRRYGVVLRELRAYRDRDGAGFAALRDRILVARRRYGTAIREAAPPSTTAGTTAATTTTTAPATDQAPFAAYPALLFDLADDQWQQTRLGTQKALERLLIHGIAPGVTEDLLGQAIRLHVELLVPPAGRPLAMDLLQSTVQRPNLVPDPALTRERAEKAAEDVPPVLVSRQANELVVQAGERILPGQLALLDHYGLSRRGINGHGLLQLAGGVAIAIALFGLIEQRLQRGLRRRDHLLLLLLVTSTPLLANLSAELPLGMGGALTNLPAVGLLVGSFYGSVVGALTTVLLTAVLPFGTVVDWNFLVANGAGGLLAALLAGRLRSREEMAFLGLAVGLTQGAVYSIVNLIDSAAAESVWSTVLGSAALYGLAGLAWCVVALGLSPYLEHLFDLVTPIRLAELSNPNRPLLKRLAAEAPGTFQHTLFVASLAEAAARTLGCNVELVRAGTLYHDIGKLHDPDSFIENQMGGPNKHDTIDDPWRSAAIIKRHVTEGLLMARRYRLPKAIQAFIPEHQGTMTIAYFYHQALERQGASGPDPSQSRTQGCRLVEEEDFRYPGPIPQSRETGIVMLADSCEAALRSLKDATHDEALSMVTKIVRARWRDQQLVDAGLSRADLSAIAEIFVRVWQQVNHQRIAYPKAVLGK